MFGNASKSFANYKMVFKCYPEKHFTVTLFGKARKDVYSKKHFKCYSLKRFEQNGFTQKHSQTDSYDLFVNVFV